MKTLTKTTLIVLLFTFWGCSKDDSSSSQRDFSELSGTWKVTSYFYDGTTTYHAINNNDAWNTSYHAEGWLLNFTFLFTENPNEYTVSGNHNVDYYFTDENGEEFYYYANLIRDESGNYVRNSNTNLTFNENGEFAHVIIQELNDTTLKFRVSKSSSETTSDNIVISRTRNENYAMERIN